MLIVWKIQSKAAFDDLMILVGPFQLRMFYNSMFLTVTDGCGWDGAKAPWGTSGTAPGPDPDGFPVLCSGPAEWLRRVGGGEGVSLPQR